MTRQRNDSHSTEFGLWLRQQAEIDSSKGYIATNIDYMWRNYKTGRWLLLEEKRFGRQPARCQKQMFDLLNWCAKHHPRFVGFYILVFEKTSPDDGKMWLNGKEIDGAELIKFLQMID